jgi:hypothetical protein
MPHRDRPASRSTAHLTPRSTPAPIPISPGNWPIANLPGLAPEMAATLLQHGIHSTQDLLDRCTDDRAILALANDLHLAKHHVRKWIALADLARVPGVGCTYAGTLLHAGIASAAQLAATPIHRLHPQLVRLWVATTQQRNLCPDRAIVSDWLTAARSLIRDESAMNSR